MTARGGCVFDARHVLAPLYLSRAGLRSLRYAALRIMLQRVSSGGRNIHAVAIARRAARNSAA